MQVQPLRRVLHCDVYRSISLWQVVEALCAIGKVPTQNSEAGCEKKLRLSTLKGRRLDDMQVRCRHWRCACT